MIDRATPSYQVRTIPARPPAGRMRPLQSDSTRHHRARARALTMRRARALKMS